MFTSSCIRSAQPFASWPRLSSRQFGHSSIDVRHSRTAAAPGKLPLIADEPTFNVLYEDRWILVINKPAGIKHEPLHRFMGGSLVNQIKGYLGEEGFTVHRLDMYTSGVLLFSKARHLVKLLALQNREGQMHKKYLALCVGLPEELNFTVDAPILRNPDHSFARMVSPAGQHAKTHFSVLAANHWSRVSLLEATLTTGRTHQIRVHLQHAGYPILCDEIYGCCPLLWDGIYGPRTAQSNRAMETLVFDDSITERLPMQSQALHSWKLTFLHPIHGHECTFEAPLPPDFKAAMASCRIDDRCIISY